MREVELKAAVPDPGALRAALANAGARAAFKGLLVDRRYDTAAYDLQARDEVVRIRTSTDGSATTARLDFKGPASYPGGFKVREEVGTRVDDPAVIERVLAAAGLRVTREVEREVEVWELNGATVRLEVYPRMDVLVEVEGEPQAIERAIAAMGLPRSSFSAERLAEFVLRFERRTGQRAALCALELAGDLRYRLEDA